MIGEIPSQIARDSDVPNGQEPSYLPRVLSYFSNDSIRENPQRLRQNSFQQAIDRFIIIVLWTIQAGHQLQLVIGLEQGQRQVVIDVRIHSRQRELNAVHACFEAGLKQSIPRTRSVPRLIEKPGDRSKVESSKINIEPR